MWVKKCYLLWSIEIPNPILFRFQILGVFSLESPNLLTTITQSSINVTWIFCLFVLWFVWCFFFVFLGGEGGGAQDRNVHRWVSGFIKLEVVKIWTWKLSWIPIDSISLTYLNFRSLALNISFLCSRPVFLWSLRLTIWKTTRSRLSLNFFFKKAGKTFQILCNPYDENSLSPISNIS